jgi:iron only hydrogenase large subunit-like protein
MGVKAVYDTSSSRDLALIEACNEFVSRYQLNQLSGDKEAGASLPVLSSACPGKKMFVGNIRCFFHYVICCINS